MSHRERVPPGFVLKYYAYRGASAVAFTAPIWYLYLEATTGSYALAAAANAVWWGGLILFEVPTGYVGDRIGRRRSLLVGAGLRVLATGAMAFVGSFPEVVVVFTVWAFATTFQSGTADAWLYEVLADRVGEGAFARVRGRGGTVAGLVAAVTAVAGGYVAAGSMADAYLASAAVTALAVPAVLSFPRSPTADDGDGDGDEDTFTVLDAIPVLREQFGRPPLRSFVLLVGLYTGVHWGVNFFVQPVGVELGLGTDDLGWLFGGFTVATAAVSYASGWLREHVGVRRWFTVVPPALAVCFLAAAVVPVLAIPVFFLMRALRGAAMPLANQFINDRVTGVGRATVLSTAGMVYNAVTVPFELAAGTLGDLLGPLPTVGLFGGLLLAGSLAVLAAGSPFGSTDVGAEPVD